MKFRIMNNVSYQVREAFCFAVARAGYNSGHIIQSVKLIYVFHLNNLSPCRATKVNCYGIAAILFSKILTLHLDVCVLQSYGKKNQVFSSKIVQFLICLPNKLCARCMCNFDICAVI